MDDRRCRHGHFPGSPRVALLLTSLVAVLLILLCTFEQIVAIGAVLFLVSYLSAFL